MLDKRGRILDKSGRSAFCALAADVLSATPQDVVLFVRARNPDAHSVMIHASYYPGVD